jgi:predicted nucleic acid-binding protein
MDSRPPVAVFDACVLYPFHVRNLLIQCAVDGLVDPRWTDDIHAEWMSNLAANAPHIPIERLELTRARLKAVLPDADVVGYRDLVPTLALPDENDRHVLAAAIVGKASVIVTWNLKDFPAASLAPHSVTCIGPDEFLMQLHAAFPDALFASVERARRNLRKTVPSVTEFIGAIDRQGLSSFAEVLSQRERID